MAQEKLLVLTSLDVEEEGLFSGRYPRKDLRVANVARLRRLAPLSRELNLPLTLFCAWSVFADKDAANHVAWMRDNCGAEVGAHLHHWHTPPKVTAGDGPPERSAVMDREKLQARLASLLSIGAAFQGAPLTSFRMGRWDLSAALLPLLASSGIITDSSVCPLRAAPGAPDHFLAPADPYWLKLTAGCRILEAPITQVPLFRFLPPLWEHAAALAHLDKDLFHFFGALSVNPFWHSQKVMRLATRLHVSRGGRVINLFWHSSEMMPGASPHVPTEAAASAMLDKISSYLGWLAKTFNIQGVTATELAKGPWSGEFLERRLVSGQDW